MKSAYDAPNANSVEIQTITDTEFSQFRALIYELAGIALSPVKKNLVVSRLSKRLAATGSQTFGQYFRYVNDTAGTDERQIMIDLLTTNETYFFREQKHFDFLADTVASLFVGNRPLRIWSAASSSGEEAFTMAMVLAETMGSRPWEIIGTDISSRVVERAATGLYPIERGENIPVALLNKYWRKGVRSQAGTMLASSELRARITFLNMNLIGDWPNLGKFDVVFLRNVMIYFDMPIKKKLVQRITQLIHPKGYLMIGHSENIHGLGAGLTSVAPAVYQRG